MVAMVRYGENGTHRFQVSALESIQIDVCYVSTMTILYFPNRSGGSTVSDCSDEKTRNSVDNGLIPRQSSL